MIVVPGQFTNSFRTVYGNVLSTRPAAALGTSITPGNNVMGTATSISVTATKACYGVLININSGATSTAARNMLVNIMMDPAGGTTYTTTLLPYLIGSCAAPFGTFNNGIWYYFPIYVPTGATLAAQASVNNATVGTVRVAAWLFTDPMCPDALTYGHKCEAIGAVTASSEGTAVTAGTTSVGTWTSLGNSTQDNFWWQSGFSINNGTITALIYKMDLSADNDATTPKLLIRDSYICTSSVEQISYGIPIPTQCSTHVASGTTIYGRAQCSSTLITGTTMIAYGVA